MGTDMNTKTIGFIGLGVMGSAMAGHLKASGERLIVYTRTRAKAQMLLDAGAEWSDSLAQLAQQCDVIFTMVGYPSDVEEVYFGPDGLLAHARQGTILVDMTTSRPDLAIRIHEAGRQKGIRTLDAPVSGGDIGALSVCLSHEFVLQGRASKSSYRLEWCLAVHEQGGLPDRNRLPPHHSDSPPS